MISITPNPRKGNLPQISGHNCQHILHKSPPFFLSYSNRSCLKILQRFLQLFFEIDLVQSLRFLTYCIFGNHIRHLYCMHFVLLRKYIITERHNIVFFFFFFYRLRIDLFDASLRSGDRCLRNGFYVV